MVRGMLLLAALVAAPLPSYGSSKRVAPCYVAFEAPRWRFFLTYKKGGETKAQVRKRTGAAFVTNAPYFNMDGKPLQAVDLYWIRDSKNLVGRFLRQRPRKCAWRPVLVITGARGVRIDWPSGRPWKPRKGDLQATGIDTVYDPRRVCWRQVIGSQNGRTAFIRRWGSHASVMRAVKAKGTGIRRFAVLDGGHACNADTKAPVHLYAVRVAEERSLIARR